MDGKPQPATVNGAGFVGRKSSLKIIGKKFLGINLITIFTISNNNLKTPQSCQT